MIAIVGAGLAGLSCAQELQRRGREFAVFEADDEPGGRVRSEHVDGFTLDRGFQVILSSYPAVEKAVNIPALQPRYFEQGALLWNSGRLTRLASPFSGPRAFLDALFCPVIPIGDKVRLALELSRLVLTQDASFIAACGSASDQSVAEWAATRGFSGRFVSRFLQPFFGGVLIDNELTTSAGLFRYYLKKFATGRAWIPAGGIGAFPRAMADSLPRDSIRYGMRVRSISGSRDGTGNLTFEDGTKFSATSIVLALDEPSLATVLGGTARPGRSVSVVYFKTRRSLYRGGFLVLPEGKNRTVRHFAQVTNVAPEFAPEGWHLISATVLDPRAGSDIAEIATREIAEVFPDPQLAHLATVRVPYAIPIQPPGFAGRVQRISSPPNVLFAGDWATGASIQSALDSGKIAAGQCD
ncbi:MAG: protoporphyrinogen/coproporphyrinogen oxidase [Terrimicrobiaceae bacterium]|jgi:protoporphyrinogen oxidase